MHVPAQDADTICHIWSCMKQVVKASDVPSIVCCINLLIMVCLRHLKPCFHRCVTRITTFHPGFFQDSQSIESLVQRYTSLMLLNLDSGKTSISYAIYCDMFNSYLIYMIVQKHIYTFKNFK